MALEQATTTEESPALEIERKVDAFAQRMLSLSTDKELRERVAVPSRFGGFVMETRVVGRKP